MNPETAWSSEMVVTYHIIARNHNLKMEAAWSSEMVVTYKTTRCHNLKMEAG
jgi:hypothetical protein